MYYWNKKQSKWVYANEETVRTHLLKQNTLIDKSIICEKNIRIGSNIKIGANVKIGSNSTIYWDTYIGDNTSIGANTIIDFKTSIGDFCTIGNNTEIKPYSFLKNNIKIGNNVIIGKGVLISSFVTIKNDVQIGDYTLIGKESVIGTDIESRMEIPPLQIVTKPIEFLSKEFIFLRFGVLPNEEGNYTLYCTEDNFNSSINYFYSLKYIIPIASTNLIEVTVNIKDITKADYYIEAFKFTNPKKVNFNLNFKKEVKNDLL